MVHRGQQVQGLLLGPGELDSQTGLYLLRWVGHSGPPVAGVQGIRIRIGLTLGRRGSVAAVPGVSVHQPADGGDDILQGEVGGDLHLHSHPVAALLPGREPVVPGQLLPLGGHEESLVLHRVAQGADGPAGGLAGAGDHHRNRRPLAPGQVLNGSQAVAQVGRGQGRSLAQDAHGAASRERNQQVVRPLAVVVHPDGVSLRVGVGDEGGHVVEHGHGVQALGQDAEPLAGHRMVGQEGLGPSLKGCGGADALFRGEVAALRF